MLDHSALGTLCRMAFSMSLLVASGAPLFVSSHVPSRMAFDMAFRVALSTALPIALQVMFHMAFATF